MLAALLIALTVSAVQCSTPAPGPGWVCQNGGWLPPGHPAIKQPAPQPQATAPSANPFRPMLAYPAPPVSTEAVFLSETQLQAHAKSGDTLPSGYIYFTPPIHLREMTALRGAGNTVLVPNTKAGGPLFVVEATVYWPLRQRLEGFLLQCQSPTQTGLAISAQNVTIDEVFIYGCDEAINLSFSLNTLILNSLFSLNRVGIHAMGAGPTPPNSLTTLRISGCRIVHSSVAALKVGHAMSLVMESTIMESNPGAGVLIAPTFPGAHISVLLRDVWFEANGRDVVDGYGVVKAEGFTRGH
jgi:hypothetical protein